MKWPLSLEMGKNMKDMKVVPLVVQGPHITLWCPLPDWEGYLGPLLTTHTGCRMRASSLLSA